VATSGSDLEQWTFDGFEVASLELVQWKTKSEGYEAGMETVWSGFESDGAEVQKEGVHSSAKNVPKGPPSQRDALAGRTLEIKK